MKQQGLAFFTDLHWTSLGLILFFAVFLFIVIHTYSPAQKEIYKKLEQRPLDEEPQNESR